MTFGLFGGFLNWAFCGPPDMAQGTGQGDQPAANDTVSSAPVSSASVAPAVAPEAPPAVAVTAAVPATATPAAAAPPAAAVMSSAPVAEPKAEAPKLRPPQKLTLKRQRRQRRKRPPLRSRKRPSLRLLRRPRLPPRSPRRRKLLRLRLKRQRLSKRRQNLRRLRRRWRRRRLRKLLLKPRLSLLRNRLRRTRGGTGRDGYRCGQKAQRLKAARRGKPDDLKLIEGIGAKLEERLNEWGVFHFDQIAAWGDQEVAYADNNVPRFKGRASRDKWVAQAKLIVSEGVDAFLERAKTNDY